jgi:hypothetical protein
MAYDAPKIVSLVKSGKGPADMFAGSHQASSMAKLHEEIANDMRVLQGAMQEHWTGDAAGQAYSGAGPLVQASQVSGQHLQQAQTLYSGQGSSYSDLQNKVNSVGDLGTRPQNDWVSDTPLSFLSNRSDQINQWDQKAQQVVDSYNVYHGQSADNSSKWPAQYGELGLPPGGADIKPTVGIPGSGQSSSGTSGSPSGSGGGGFSGNTSGWNGGTGSTGGAGRVGAPGGTSGPSSSVRPPAYTSPSFSGTTPAGHMPNSPGDPGSAGFVPGIPGGMYGNPSSGAGGFGPGAGGFGAGFGPGGGGYGSGGGAGSRVSGGFGPGSGGRSSGAGAMGGASASGAGMAGEPGAGGRAAGTAAPGGRAGAPGAGGMGRGGKGEGSEDAEHQRPSYLLEPDPDDALVGKLPQSVPPVIGL